MTKVLPGHFSTYQVSQGFGHAFPFGEAAQENVSLETPFQPFSGCWIGVPNALSFVVLFRLDAPPVDDSPFEPGLERCPSQA